MALKDILANGSKYADDMILTLPDGSSATVGEMRSLESEEKQALLLRSQTMAQAEGVLAARIHEAQQKGYLNPQQQQHSDPELRRAAQNEYGLDESDPLLGQVVKEMKRMEADRKTEMAALTAAHTAEIKNLTSMTAKATGAYLNDRYSTTFRSATANLPADIAKKVTLEDAVKFAETNRLMDSIGAYDINAAVDRLTWNDMKEHERGEIRKSSMAEAEKAAQMARVKPTGIRTAEPPNKGGFDPFVKDGERTRTKSLDEVLAEAANDDTMWSTLASGFGPN